MTKPIIKSDEEWSWWDDNRGGIIFWSIAVFLILFLVCPWSIGMAKILTSIF